MQINRNIFFAEALIDFFATRKIDHVVLSPGSRNTPLTFAAAQNKRIKTYTIIDERAAAFFASGLARSLGKPVILICTSGTAAAEYLPAVVESFFQQIPLVVITADRPAKLRGTGANQTIFQDNLYGKHVLKAWDVPPAEINKSYVKKISGLFKELAGMMDSGLRGPVHLNIQMDKPFEPDDFTDELSAAEVSGLKTSLKVKKRKAKLTPVYTIPSALVKKLKAAQELLIFCGPDAVKTKEDIDSIARLANKFNAPVLCDGFSGINKSHKHVFSFFSYHLYTDRISREIKPGVILQFGNLPVSKAGEEVLAMQGVTRIIVNKDGMLRGKYENRAILCKAEIPQFAKSVIKAVKEFKYQNSFYYERIIELEREAEAAKRKGLDSNPFSEAEIVKSVAENCSARNPLMIGNSMPPRDLDFIFGLIPGNVNMFHNRGASGIDGIIVTSAGLSAGSSSRTFLVIGDVSFFYDLTSLNIVRQQNLNLTIILLNNGGGRIFDMLPVKRFPEMVKGYYNTPAGLDFRKLVDAFGIKYDSVKTIKELNELLGQNISGCHVIECKTSIETSIKLREDAKKHFRKNEFS